MDKETFLSKITEIGTCEDASTRLTMLAEVSDEVSKVYDDMQTRQTTIDTLNETIKNKDEKLGKLQEANMDLFLRVNAQKTPEQQKQDLAGIKKEPEVNKRKFEDLFEGGK